MSVDRDYNIRIKIDADQAGQRAAQKGIEDINEAVNKGGKEAEHSGESHRALHQVLHLIGSQAGPEAGAALSGVAAAATGGMLLAVMAVKELVGALREAAEEANQFREKLEGGIDLSGLKTDVDSVKTSIGQAGTEVDQFFAKIKEKEGEHSFKKIADEQIEHLQRVAAEEKKLAGEEAEREKARLEFLKSTKQITDEQYKAGIAAAEALKGKKEGDAEANFNSQSTQALHLALSNILMAKEAARRDLKGMGDPAQAEHRLKTLGGLDDAAQKRIQELLGLQESNQGNLTLPSLWNEITGHPFESTEQFRARRNEEITGELTKTRAYDASIRGQMGDLRTNGPSQEKVKAKEDKLSGLQSDADAITAELGKRGDQGQLDKDTGTAEFVNQFLGARGRLMHHAGGPGDSSTIEAMNRLVESSKQTDLRMLALIRELINHNGNLSQALAATNTDMAGLKTRVNNLR